MATTTSRRGKKPERLKCCCCGNVLAPGSFYTSKNSRVWNATDGKVLFCKDCLRAYFLENKDRYGEAIALHIFCYLVDLPFDMAAYEAIISRSNTFDISDYVKWILVKIGKKQMSYANTIFGEEKPNEIPFSAPEQDQPKVVKWSKEETANKTLCIEVLGYDPFEGNTEEGRKELFGQLVKYFDDDTVEDPYKLSQIAQLCINNYQIKQYNTQIADLDPINDIDAINNLVSIKESLVRANDKIAKENEISVKNRSNKEIGRNTLTYLMKSLRERDIPKAEADYYEQLRSPATQWVVNMSNKALIENGMFDENDLQEILETQRELIQSQQKELDELKIEKKELLRKLNGGSNG